MSELEVQSTATVRSPAMALSLHLAPHPDALVALLCDQLLEAPEDPLAAELISVPSRGIERWLSQQIACGLSSRGAGDGICANIEFPSPFALVHRVLASIPEVAASAAAWEGPALTAAVLETIDASVHEPWMWLIARYLEHGDGPDANRFSAAQKVARLFYRYGRRRPGMIRDWHRGLDTGPDGSSLVEDSHWQPILWRLLRQRIGVPSLPELIPQELAPVCDGVVRLDLPPRIALYGLTTTDPLDLEVLAAASHQHEVHLYLLHPSPALWEDARSRIGSVPVERSADPTAELPRHPLLAAWGRDSRELQSVLGQLAVAEVVETREFSPSVLGRLQSDIAHNRTPQMAPALTRDVINGQDRSVQVHVCHGTRRQAEVARDAILHLLASDPTLEPRDIVIMTPDLATFAPLLEAAFPPEESGGLPDLRLRIADRSPAAANPLVLFAAGLLDLMGSRLEANLVRELVARPVVQHKFGFDADTAGEVIGVIDDANISWGMDEDDRERWGAGAVADRTWRRGVRRALAGVFYGDDPARIVGDIAPLEGVEGQDATPVGILAAIVDRLEAVKRVMDRPLPMSGWGVVIGQAVRMLAAPPWGEEWQLDQLERLLAETFPAPPAGAPDPEMSLAEARQAISVWADDRPSPLHFRGGDLTVCTLVPMRSVPYRVVCLLGMDDGRFPRRGDTDGDDLLGEHELVGDTDRGSADRQLLLDAVMAAGDHLIVTYSGRDELTNSVFPPAVPIAELIDVVAGMVGPEAFARITTEHPLQSFSMRNFVPGDLGLDGPWGFDLHQWAGAQAIGDRQGVTLPPVIVWPDPELSDEPVRLIDLISFLQNPARRFLRARLGFSIPEPGDIPDDTLPADSTPLDRWQATDRILSGLIAGHDPERLAARERGRDALPPGDLGLDDLERAVATATTLWSAAAERGYDPGHHQPYAGKVEVEGVLIEGTVSADPSAGHIATVTPSQVKAKHRLEAYVRLVFLTALDASLPWKAILLGRRDGGDGHVAVAIGPLRGDEVARRQDAIGRLSDLTRLYLDGLRQPLPLPCETGYLWRRKAGTDLSRARYAARDAFETGKYCESKDLAFRMLFPDISSVESLEGVGLDDFSSRVWLPVLSLTTEKQI